MRAGPWGRGYAVDRRYTVDEPALPAEPIRPAAPPNSDAARGYYGDANVVRLGYRANEHESAYRGNGRHGAARHGGAPDNDGEAPTTRPSADGPLYGRRPGEVRGPVEGGSRLVGPGSFEPQRAGDLPTPPNGVPGRLTARWFADAATDPAEGGTWYTLYPRISVPPSPPRVPAPPRVSAPPRRPAPPPRNSAAAARPPASPPRNSAPPARPPVPPPSPAPISPAPPPSSLLPSPLPSHVHVSPSPPRVAPSPSAVAVPPGDTPIAARWPDSPLWDTMDRPRPWVEPDPTEELRAVPSDAESGVAG